MIRPMILPDLEITLDWAAAEGWNPGVEDAAAFLATDPDGFFVAESNGRPVAAISVVNHDAGFAFLGLYLCHPAYRGLGIGFALWNHAMAHAGARTIGLDGVAAQQGNYAKSGFLPNGATLRLQGQMLPLTPTLREAGPDHLREAGPDDFAAIAALDRVANGYEQRAFLAGWTMPTASRRTVVIERRGDVYGYATARLCRDGCKIGPVVAPDAVAAMTLISAAAATVGTQLVTVDIPATNTALLTHLLASGFAETFRTARMYRGVAPFAAATLQAIGTMELG